VQQHWCGNPYLLFPGAYGNRGSGMEKASSKTIEKNKIEAQRSGFDFERKREISDMELSRRLRKPGKRNGESFL
jgi:hypothetical protein